MRHSPLWTMLLLLLLPLAGWGSDVPDVADFFPGLDEDSMRVRLAEADLQPMEGIWFFPDEDMTLGIERCAAVGHNERYRIIMLASSDLHLLPGTVIGYLQASALPTKWQLWLYTERDQLTLAKPMSTVATSDASCTHITFDRPHWRVKVRLNVARFLPSIFRGLTISPEKVEEELPVGFRKVYPEGSDGQAFNRIRYL
ncbi:MAG: hypothetical protein IJT30_06635 [Muribaculaceae bacterium]|nr:hypothetical protein [Muribaculaceae bacterium]